MVPALTRSAAVTWTPVLSYRLKPCASTITEYVPGWTDGNTKSPEAEDVADCRNPIPELTRVTGARGTAAPLASTTVPLTTPVIVCAHIGGWVRPDTASKDAAIRPVRRCFIVRPLYISTWFAFAFHFMRRPFLSDRLPSCVTITA